MVNSSSCTATKQWPGDKDWAVIHIFRLDDDGKIVEHWNLL
jgi:predicted SnoaL-like aldol condensation-catalyzing enzyme